MKREELKQTWNKQLTSQFEAEAAIDTLCETDLESASPARYERRRKMWSKFNQGDWWIAIAVYLILSSVALVIL